MMIDYDNIYCGPVTIESLPMSKFCRVTVTTKFRPAILDYD